VQPKVAMSSMEAEYRPCILILVSFQDFLDIALAKLGYTKQTPISVYEDNQSAILFSRSNTCIVKFKDIDVIYHFFVKTCYGTDHDTEDSYDEG